MSTTVSYEVSPYKRKDGTYLIKIRMIHNREVLRKPTSVYVRREQLTRDLSKIRDVGVLDAVVLQLERIRRAVASVQGAEFLPADALWDAVMAELRKRDGFSLDFFAYAEGKMAAMEKGTASGYRTSLNALKRFIGRDTLDINEITYRMLVEFRTFLESEPALADGSGSYGKKSKGCRAVSYYLGCLRHIHNLAREEYNDDDVGLIRIPRQPFKQGLIPRQPVTEHRVMSLLQLRSMLRYEAVTERGRLAKDVFLLSFMLVGMNTADLFVVGKEQCKDGVLTYNRAKTDSVRLDKALMRVRVEPEALPLFERYKGDKLLFSFCDRYSDIKGFNKAVNNGLKEVGAAIGVEGLTTYHARHTWATLARNECGVDFDTVHESLNHASRGNEKVTDIYVERDFSRVWEANRRVLDIVFNTQKKERRFTTPPP